jgi:hypothetical protein
MLTIVLVDLSVNKLVYMRIAWRSARRPPQIKQMAYLMHSNLCIFVPLLKMVVCTVAILEL